MSSPLAKVKRLNKDWFHFACFLAEKQHTVKKCWDPAGTVLNTSNHAELRVCVCERESVHVWERKRERVWVCERECKCVWERKRESVSVCVRVRERVFVHVCVCERERERECACVRASVRVCVSECVCESECVCVCVWERERVWLCVWERDFFFFFFLNLT